MQLTSSSSPLHSGPLILHIMNRTPSKAAARRRRAQPKVPADPDPENYSPRSPLKDLNGGVFRTSSSSCSTSTTASIESPRGCLRFLISNSLSSSSSKMPPHRPKPNSRKPKISTNGPQLKPYKPPDERRMIGDGGGTNSFVEEVRKNERKVSRLCRWQSGKKSSSLSFHKPEKEILSAFCNDSGSGRLQEQLGEKKARVQVRDCEGESGKEFKFTPVGWKVGSGCDLECGFDPALGSQCDTNGRGNTPPVEASVSPEIQSGSSVMSAATPVCFGAGHVISGVSDKKKCRPRGVLVVGAKCSEIDGLRISDSYYNLDGTGDVDSGLMVVPPLPAEASMHWLLSPGDEDDDKNGEGELRASVLLSSPLSCSSSYGTSSNVTKDKTTNIISSATALVKTGMINSLVSPSGKVVLQSLLGSPSNHMASRSSVSPHDKGFIYWFDDKVSPSLTGQTSSSSMDTSGSKNIIQTPESNKSTEIHMRLPWNGGDDGKHVLERNLVCAADGQKRTCFSSEGQVLTFEQIDSSFEFDSLLKPSSSIDFSQLRHNWGVENALQSQLRISWRDGLSRRIFEMDELDCCRCLSDEEDRTDRDAFNHASPEPKLSEITTESFMRIFDVKDVACPVRNESSSPHKSIPFAESISMDGGSLAALGDSGWDMCYKNNLFQDAL